MLTYLCCMAGNSIGTLFRLTTFGESHGAAIGGILEGCEAGLELDRDFIRKEMLRRKPGQSEITTQRKEDDEVEFLSGVFEGKTIGTPIGFIIRNKDHQSADYDHLKEVYRPGHADEVWMKKFGVRDYRGGGRSSARETAARVVGGSIAKLLLAKENIEVNAFVSSVKDIVLDKEYHELNLKDAEQNIVRCPDEATAKKMISCIEAAKENGDSVGGVITCIISGVPAGLGEPVFDKLHAVLGHAMLSINAVKGFEIGNGFQSTKLYGSENNTIESGIAGGISTGEDIVLKVAFKPVSTIAKAQQTKDIHGNEVTLEAKGRHDPCVLPRAVVIIEAMAALVIEDFMLLQRANRR
jgi:chorismate synthase